MNNSSAPDSRLRIVPPGNTLSLFLVISYLLCVAFALLAPAQMRMYEAWAPLLPGFEWLTWRGFPVGLVETLLYGWYIAVLFVPLYRWFSNTQNAK